MDLLRRPYPTFIYLYGGRNITIKTPRTTTAHVASGYQAEGDPVTCRIAVLSAAWVQRVKVVVDVINPKRAYKTKIHVISLRKRSNIMLHNKARTLSQHSN